MENKSTTRGISLSKVSHVKNVCRRIIAQIIRDGTEVEHATRVTQLLNVWLRAHELEIADDLEKRVASLEAKA
jgi:hypothetical protein